MDGNQEIPAGKEVFSTAKQTVALQARLILGSEALKPNNLKLDKVTNESLQDISSETFVKLSNASTNERVDYWHNKRNGDPSLNTYEDQMKSWVTDVVKFVNQENFTEKEAMDMYNDYFIGEGKISAIDRYVISIVNQLSQLKQSKTDVNLDEILEQSLPEIKKMANIFGSNSSELIEAAIRSELKLIDENKKAEFVNQVNEEKDTGQNKEIRLNYLNHDEERLLSWLDQNQTLNINKSDSTSHPQSGEYYWKYRRLDGDVRIFPKELTYAKLALDLRTDNPSEFGKYSTRELSSFVAKQLEETQAQLDKFGLTQQELKNLSLDFVDKQVLSHYREFIQKKFNISLPSTEEIQILPVSGSIAKAHDKTGRGLAFVDTKYPVIFLNVDNIASSAQRIMGQSWDSLSPTERHQYFKRILTEINPHEYTHLLGDIAFWELTAKDGQGNEKELESFAGKLGLKVGKPKNLKETSRGVEFQYFERGRGLMEAVTVELTQQWVKSMGKELTAIYGRPIGMRLDIPAYPGEREVLYALENIISQDQGISNDKAFEIFVRAYFKKDGFREIVQAIDDHKIGPDGHPMTRKPYFTSMIYSLMQYESEKTKTSTTATNYPLTLNFIWGKLTETQKQEILTNINKLEIAPTIKNHLSTLLGSTVPIPSEPARPQENPKRTEIKIDPLLIKLFGGVQGEVSKNHRYYVENPPNQINLTEEQMEQLNLVEPFFVNITGDRHNFGYDVNGKVVPFVIEMDHDGANPNQRFIDGEAATNGDSGLVGLAAASAPTPEKQARLYTTLARAVIDIHQKRFTNSNRPSLFDSWYGTQQEPNRWNKKDTVMDSLAIFEIHDHVDPGSKELRPENERLFVYDKEGNLDAMDQTFWIQRTDELEHAINNNRLSPHHIRWIELLAHSVNVAELVQIIKKS